MSVALNPSVAAQLDRYAATIRNIGIAQVCFGVLGLFISFSWIDAIISICLGATAITAYNASSDSLSRAQRIKNSCITGLAIAEFVLGSLAIFVFIITFAIVGVALIALLNFINNPNTIPTGDNSYYTVYCTASDPGCKNAKALIGWIVTCLLLGWLLPAIQVTLAGVQLCSYNALCSIVARETPSNNGGVTVIMMGGQPGQAVVSPNPYAQAVYAQQPQMQPQPGYPQQVVYATQPPQQAQYGDPVKY